MFFLNKSIFVLYHYICKATFHKKMIKVFTPSFSIYDFLVVGEFSFTLYLYFIFYKFLIPNKRNLTLIVRKIRIIIV